MAFPGGLDPALGLGVGPGISAGIGGPFGGIGGAAGPLGAAGGIGGPFGGIFKSIGIPALPFPPYIPVTPLGALEAFKGDLIIPIVVIGVALFILLVIVLAVKAALLWKAELLGLAVGGIKGKKLRSLPDTPPAHDEDHMSTLATVVMSALDNQRCLEKIICSVGTYGQGSTWPQWVSMMEGLISEDYKHSLTILKQCAEGTAKPEDFSCGANGSKNANQGFPQQQKNGQQGFAGQGANNSTLNNSSINNKNASAKGNQSKFNDSSNHL